ncbi:cation:proton antiporter [Candidatus Micrarchaeota archaeon]|nr:cation:proton antiporter [Candidatus Micrarchaeota archaeon]
MVEFLQNIEFQISLLLFIALIGYFLAIRFGQSIVIGEILVGILVGPSVLGLITYTEFIEQLATMGAIFLLFVVGLQTKFKEIFNARSMVIALIGVIVPWIGGFGVAQLFGFPLGQAVFIGTALTATSIAITAQVLKEMGKLDTAAAKAIIGAAVVDDVLALLALSLTKEFLTGTVSLNNLAITTVVALAFLAIGVVLGTKVLNPQLERFDKWAKKNGVEKATFIAAIAIAFAYGLVAEVVGLSAIVGAFIAGVSLESLRIRSYHEGSEYLEAIFAAIFFVSLGVLVNIQAAASAGIFIIALTTVAILTKLVGCFIPARAMGLNTSESLIVGLGMVPRGEIAIIAALFGLSNGLIGQPVYAAILMMSLLTTIVTPIFIKQLYAGKGYRPRVRASSR